MKFHHVGYLVSDLKKAIEGYSNLLRCDNSCEIFDIADQQVKVCFLKISDDSFLELVNPYEENRTLQKMLKRGNTFYHLGFQVNNFDDEILRLESEGYVKVNEFHSAAFQNLRCSFLMAPDLSLIEIIENK